jgi:hypothetical protein
MCLYNFISKGRRRAAWEGVGESGKLLLKVGYGLSLKMGNNSK